MLTATMPWRDCAVVLFDRELERQMLYDRIDWAHPNRRRFHERNLPIIEEVASLEDALIEDPIQVAYNGSVDAMRAVIARLESLPSAGDLSIALTEYTERDFALVDVFGAGVNKGSGLAALAESLAIDRSEVLAVGDNFNDRDMLAWAGRGILMGNAAAEMRVFGFELTGTNDEAGLAQAIRRHALV